MTHAGARKPGGSALTLAVVALMAACTGGGDGAPRRSPAATTSAESGTTTTTTATTATTTSLAETDGVRVVAAGDIACLPGRAPTAGECQMEATAALAESLRPDVVLPLGDLQYELGKGPDYVAGYDTNWGRLKTVTRPVPGNHEYTGGRAAGYFGYFGDVAHGPDGWYSFDAGAWHVIVLNSVCGAVGGCETGSRQHEWLRADLAATPSDCLLAAWHHPRWSSGLHRSSATMQPLWQLLASHGADLVLSGHDHHYERFAPRDGIVQLVAGTGGRSLYPVFGREEGTVASQARGFGVVELLLSPSGWTSTFRPVPGFDYADTASGRCSG